MATKSPNKTGLWRRFGRTNTRWIQSAGYNLFQAYVTAFSTFVAVTTAPVFAPAAWAGTPLFWIGLGMGGVAGTVRTAMQVDFYAREKAEQGNSNRFTRWYSRQWNKTGLRFLSDWKVETRKRDRLITLFLHEATDGRDVVRTKKDIKAEIKAINRIIRNVSPIYDLQMVIAVPFLSISSVRLGLHMLRNTANSTISGALQIAVILGLGAYIVPRSLSFAFKKVANRTPNPIFSKVDAWIQRRPLLNKMARYALRNRLRRIDKIQINDVLAKDLKTLDLDYTLTMMKERSGFIAKGSLVNYFAAHKDVLPEVQSALALNATGINPPRPQAFQAQHP